MRFGKLTAAVAGLAATALVVTGCGSAGGSGSELAGSWDEIVTAATEEGSVTIYSNHAPANLEALKAAFEAKYPGIELTYVRGTDSDLIPKVEVENRTGNGVADVHMTTDAGWIQRSLDAGEYSVEVVAPAVENPDYRAEDGVLDDTFFVTSATSIGLAWNTQNVPGGLASPEDLLDPRLEGKVGVVTPAGYPAVVHIYRRMDIDYGEAFVERLAALDPRIYTSGPGVTQALASGEVWAAPGASMDVLVERDKGAPVDFALPENPIGIPFYSHVLSAAPNPNAAQLLADFMVTAEGQEALSENYIAALPGIPGTGVEGSDVVAQDLELADPDTLEASAVSEYVARWEQMFLG
ncbi:MULTISPECIES: ABC transporter substrate-binding protein [Dietzia]|uniref:ABC transporter substrate-binding protein n=1 Tax=Dietzia TaxID=37914 RepID=UPI0022B3A06C|nr:MULTISPECIES: extracellular solute-binding protein [Dietzia]MCZ4538571.1 extracellular solute-binding protein [Dietzia maris]MDV3355063.1 extracellular solute-binding protein [Dietzia sp. IN118]